MLTISQFARKQKVSRQKAYEWVVSGRVPAENPAQGVYLIADTERRPVKMRPWSIRRAIRMSYEGVY
jgi:hypothetical protein